MLASTFPILYTCRLKSVECFTPRGGSGSAVTWHPVPDMIIPRSNFSVTVLEDKIFVTGLRQVIQFDSTPFLSTWIHREHRFLRKTWTVFTVLRDYSKSSSKVFHFQVDISSQQWADSVRCTAHSRTRGAGCRTCSWSGQLSTRWSLPGTIPGTCPNTSSTHLDEEAQGGIGLDQQPVRLEYGLSIVAHLQTLTT